MAKKKEKGNMMAAGDADAFDLDAAAEAAAVRNEAIRDGGAAGASTSTVLADSDVVDTEPGNDNPNGNGPDADTNTDGIGTASASDADNIGTSPGTDTVNAHSPEDVPSPSKAKVTRGKRRECERYRMEISIPLTVRKELEDVSARTGVSMSSLLVQAWYGKSLRDEK